MNRKSEVTAVGRLLKPRNGERRIYKVISINNDGEVRTLIEEPVEDAQ